MRRIVMYFLIYGPTRGEILVVIQCYWSWLMGVGGIGSASLLAISTIFLISLSRPFESFTNDLMTLPNMA